MSELQKYPSAIPLPPTIPRINEKPGIRGYDEIVSAVSADQLEYMRKEAEKWWSRSTDGYKNGRSDEEGIKDVVRILDLEQRLYSHRPK